MTVHYPPVTGHRVVLSDRRDCRYTCTCGLPLGRTRAESVRLHRAHKVNLYAGAADSPCEACGCTDAAHGDEYGDNRTCPHDCTGWFQC